MKRFVLVVATLYFIANGYGQSTDTAKNNTPESWKKFHIGARIGLGIQKSFFTELGLGFQRYFYEERHGFAVSGFYTSFEWIPSTGGEKPIYGAKVGGEFVNNGAAGGIEVKYLGDGEKEDVVITPKIGFGMGFVNIFYGYNFSTQKYPFPKLGKSQFSLVINTNIFFYHLKDKRK
jgi:hypothetical protein